MEHDEEKQPVVSLVYFEDEYVFLDFNAKHSVCVGDTINLYTYKDKKPIPLYTETEKNRVLTLGEIMKRYYENENLQK